MTAHLPPNLLALFAARDPIDFVPPPERLSHERKRLLFSGVGEYVAQFQPETKSEPVYTKIETKEEKRERRRKEKLERAAYKLEQDLATCNFILATTAYLVVDHFFFLGDPKTVEGTSDPYKTLFVARIVS